MPAAMLGPRITTVFRSRWRALWWAATVLIGVYFSVPRAGDDGDAGGKQAEQAVAALLQQQDGARPEQPQHHVNPWAKNPK